ncbi:glycine cleavage system aminomethyltransferase GcvT, partial [Streptomyces sp. ZEA17I]|uniref:glycine cleavage system aminomethyltransferase GcvT n=1 Tax=Streptomyces sp. ZEA17I TaxID=2202516 RepID=UPI00215A2F8F
MSTAPRLTALDATHRSLGATMTDFAGWDMPLRYASERDEHNAVRTRAGLFDLSHMGEITVTGPEAAAFLSYALVGNIATVGNGRARYTMIVQEDGGIVDDLIVYRLGETEYMVVANAGNAQIVLDALTGRVGGFDAEVRDDRDAYALLAVQGPESPAIMKAVTDADLDGLKYYAGLPGTVAGVPALIARTGYTGEDGFELFVAPEHAEALWQALTEAGAPHGLIPCGLSCRDTLRLEAGMPLYGHELTTALTPFDAGLGRVVKFEKEGDSFAREALPVHPRPLDRKLLPLYPYHLGSFFQARKELTRAPPHLTTHPPHRHRRRHGGRGHRRPRLRGPRLRSRRFRAPPRVR